jgi:hypothetical protein
MEPNPTASPVPVVGALATYVDRLIEKADRVDTDFGVTYEPFYEPPATTGQPGRIGYRAYRDGETDLVSLYAPTVDADGGMLTFVVTTHPEDATPEHSQYCHAMKVNMPGDRAVTVGTWSDGRDIGWRVETADQVRYIYLVPSVAGGTDVADVFVYVADDVPDEGDTVGWLPVHERTASE